MIRRLLAVFTKQMDTGLEGVSPQSVQISAGMARLVFVSPVTSCESAGVSIATDTGFISTPVTPAIGTDGSLLLFGGGITNGQVLKFTGTVTIAGASVPFDVIRVTSLADAQLAVASAGVPMTLISAKNVVIYGASIFFNDANTIIKLISDVSQFPVPNPLIYLRGSGCTVCVTPILSTLPNHHVDAGLGRNTLSILTEYYNSFFSIRGSYSFDSYNYSNFAELYFPYGMVLNKPAYGTSLMLNLGTKNVIGTLTFGANAGTSVNPSGDMAIISGTAKNVVINGMAESTTVNFNGGVDVATTPAFTMKGAKNLHINFTTDNAVDMAFGKLTLSNTENLHIAVADNAVANTVSVNDLSVTGLSSLTLTDADADDSTSIVLNGTLASNSLLDFSGFAGDVTLTDNIGAAVIALATAHGNTITLRAPAADGTTQVSASIVSYASATLGAGDTITLFDVTADKLRFDASLSSIIRFTTDSAGLTSVFVGESAIPAVTLPSTTGFSASNIIFTT